MVSVNKHTSIYGWGGKRSGSGRKKAGVKHKILSICGTEEEISLIKEKAKISGKSVSRFLIESVLAEI